MSSNEKTEDKAPPSKVYRIIELGDIATKASPEVASTETEKTSTKVKATLQKSLFADTEAEKTLGAVRRVLGASMPSEQNFCYADGSLAADTVKIADYLEIGKEEDSKPTADIIYVTRPKSKTATQILSQPPFMLRVFQWSASPNDPTAAPTTTSKGSVHSKTLPDATQAASMTLAGLRKLISGMSSYSTVHKFCTASGTTIEDEQLNLAEYLALEPAGANETTPTPSTGAATIPSFKVFYKTNQAFNNPTKVEIPQGLKADTTLKEPPPGKTADQFTQKERTSLIEASTITTGAEEFGASYLDDKQWAKVLGNCGVFYGWIVDRRSNRIVRAPKAAFQLRSKVLEDPIAKIPDYAPTQAPVTATPVADTPTQDSANVEVIPKASDETADSSMEPADSNNAPAKDSSAPDSQRDNGALVAPPPGESQIQVIQRAKTDQGIPNFRISDDSKIEITACQHEFEVSMARNDFSSQSTEASMSGGYAGFSASVSAGYASSKSSSSKSTTNTFERTLVARYLFPRCDLFLYSDDLEPTPELAAAVERVKSSRNIKVLRKIHTDFGQLFCQNLTLGGRLQSSKIMKATTQAQEQETKEQYKVSVGVSVSTPVGVGGSVKNDTEKGNGSTGTKTGVDIEETNVFEAVGGDTILANNPAAWAPTVAKHQFWRVINRDALAPLADVLSAIPGYRQVKSYFIQAVPAVSKFIELDDSRQVMTRFRLIAPLNGLSLKNSKEAAYYLGHMPTLKTTPRLMGVNKMDFWGTMVEYTEEKPLFSPKTIRAPVLLGYSDSKVGPAYFGSAYNQEYTETEWNILAPFNEALTHGARVILCTNPYINPADQNKPDPPVSQMPAHMVVFRNQQGVFLPGMSENDENQYWRILKKGATSESEHIKEGDEIRLCWAFNDQVTGFRDYTDDIFGRRRNQCPPELENSVLYLKLPWPRFETQSPLGRGSPPPNSMVMAPIPDTNPQSMDVKTIPNNGGSYKYVMQDLSFRIDTVANMGLGDTDDYLLKDVDQQGTRVTVNQSDAQRAVQNMARKLCFRTFFF